MKGSQLAKEVLRALEETVGREYLSYILEKTVQDLAFKFESIKSIKIPEDPSELDLSGLAPEERRELLISFINTLGQLGREDMRREFMKKLEELERA